MCHPCPGVAGQPRSGPSWPGVGGVPRPPALPEHRDAQGVSPAPAISSTAVSWWDPGPPWRASIRWRSTSWVQQGFKLSASQNISVLTNTLFPVASCFLVKFPAGCNQDLRLLPSRGCFLQQSNTRLVTNMSLMSLKPGNCFLPVHAKLCRIRCSFFFCHILKASV